MNDDESIRLNKHLALVLGVSRREADELISSGRVSVGGRPAVLGARFTPGQPVVVDGDQVGETPVFRYVVLHKPAGYVCSRRRQGDVPTIYELLPEDMRPLKAVGRLDKDSSGLLLLTNDGDFAFSYTHPKFAKTKVYDVMLAKPLEPLHQQMICDYGIDIGDGVSRLGLQKEDDERIRWTVTMTEGRNRQIRRTFAALGYEVVALHRTQFGPFALGALEAGEYEQVTP